MSLIKRILFGGGTCPALIAVGTALLGLGQAAAIPLSPPIDVREAGNGPIRLIEDTRAVDGQQNAEQLPPRFRDALQAAEELGAALSTAKEKFEALTGATQTAAAELHWRLEATRRQRDRLSATLVDVQAKLRVRESREKRLAERVAALGEGARQSEAEIAALKLELEASEQRRQQLEQVGTEVAQLKDELLGIRRLLKAANVALAQVEKERDAARAETEALRAEIAALLNTALASLQPKDQPAGSASDDQGAPSESFMKAPIVSSPEAQDRRDAGL